MEITLLQRPALAGMMRSDSSPFEVRTAKCAHCGTEKREVNHWWVLEVIADVFMCEPYGEDRTLLIGEHPVCGAGCAQKKFEQFLSTGKL